MNVHGYLKKRQGLIDRTLHRYLGKCPQHPEKLFEAMQYSVFSGGKRIRPILTLAVGELFGAKQKTLLPFACALELIHTYSLIHDDLPALDNDDLRRGKPTSHKRFGEGIALLAGDALLTEAFDLIARMKGVRALKPEVVLDLIHELAGAAGMDGMVGGQSIDLETEDQVVNLATVEYIHLRKTGALILVAARMGAIIGKAAPKDLGKVSRYGEYLGLAFQITDDILDVDGESSEVSKAETRAAKGSRATYPSVVGLPAARGRAEELLERCLKEMKTFGKEAEPLREIARYVVERAS
jgi:geranylgeranyl diphosphate synthase type II